jgi:hypothetical protein
MRTSIVLEQGIEPYNSVHVRTTTHTTLLALVSEILNDFGFR